MKPCRECNHEISEQAIACPNCGAPHPSRENWDGHDYEYHGYEYKSKAELMGLPILHISFKYRHDRKPVPAVGVIAIGQFAVGILTISQFGVGVISISQFTVGVLSVAQFAAGYAGIAQFGVFLSDLLT